MHMTPLIFFRDRKADRGRAFVDGREDENIGHVWRRKIAFEILLEGPGLALARLRGEISASCESASVHFSPDRREPGRLQALRIVQESETALDDDLVRISGLIRRVEKEHSLHDAVRMRVRNLAYSEPSIQSGEYEEPFRPTPSLTVVPWKPGWKPPRGSISIILDPSHAFGTGRHPTTRLCLGFLETLHKEAEEQGREAFRTVLDFGCGTGILGIAALRMGALRAVGVELDGEAADTARRNAERNSLSDRLEIRKGSWEAVDGCFDLIMANVVSAALLRTGGRILHHLKTRGRAVVSGFGSARGEEMVRFFRNKGLRTVHRGDLAGWGGLVLEPIPGSIIPPR